MPNRNSKLGYSQLFELEPNLSWATAHKVGLQPNKVGLQPNSSWATAQLWAVAQLKLGYSPTKLGYSPTF